MTDEEEYNAISKELDECAESLEKCQECNNSSCPMFEHHFGEE